MKVRYGWICNRPKHGRHMKDRMHDKQTARKFMLEQPQSFDVALYKNEELCTLTTVDWVRYKIHWCKVRWAFWEIWTINNHLSVTCDVFNWTYFRILSLIPIQTANTSKLSIQRLGYLARLLLCRLLNITIDLLIHREYEWQHFNESLFNQFYNCILYF